MNRKQRRASKGTKGSGPTSSHPSADLMAHLFSQGVQLHQAGNIADAEQIYRQILIIDPAHAHSLHMMGMIALTVKRYDIAEDMMRKAIAQNEFPTFYQGLGDALKMQEKFDQSIAAYEQALKLNPQYQEALSSLINLLGGFGFRLQSEGRFEDAIPYYKRAIELCPLSAEILNNLGVCSSKINKIDDTIFYYKNASDLQPDNYHVLNNLASAYKSAGKSDEAIEYYKRALSISSTDPVVYNNYLLALVYASVSPTELAEAAREFGKIIADPLLPPQIFVRNKDPERKLKIGYISPDFREHAVNYFFEPLLNLHNREHFEIYSYSNAGYEDTVTLRLKENFDHWHDIHSLDDDTAADLIREDDLDILIDLAGHTGNNRLMVMARKPAPIQVTWLGYPASTGMKAFDYRITDIYAEPEGMTEHLNVETLWRLPNVFCCYQPHINSPAVAENMPYENNGYITFGCFNNYIKITDSVLAAWARILLKLPDARLIMEIDGIDNPHLRSEVDKRLQKLGLPLDRILFYPRLKSHQYMLYKQVDIALDPFPCVGGTTSMDTLWMGVPFITLAGLEFRSRIGVSVLTNAGLTEFITRSIEDYVGAIIALAQDTERLKQVRQNLRNRFKNSPLMNPELFARNMEDAYRGMWRAWCKK